MTTFWLADNLALLGRTDEAREIFERLRAVRNDVGLFAEEYDPVAGCMVGNFPQAFSHVAFVNTAANLSLGRHGSSPRSRARRESLPRRGDDGWRRTHAPSSRPRRARRRWEDCCSAG